MYIKMLQIVVILVFGFEIMIWHHFQYHFLFAIVDKFLVGVKGWVLMFFRLAVMSVKSQDLSFIEFSPHGNPN